MHKSTHQFRGLAAASTLVLATAGLADQLLVPSDFSTIQAAMDAARDGDEVILADDVYIGFGNKDLVSNFGFSFTVRSESGNPAKCVIDCQELGRGFFFGTGEPETFRVEGITIRNGSTITGAGMVFTNEARPTIVNCVFESGEAIGTGGGVFCANASPTIVDCRFIGNVAEFDGGAAFCGQAASPRFDRCRFESNESANRGGAVYTVESEPTFINCAFTDNVAMGMALPGGGAIAADLGSLPFVANSSFGGNRSLGAGGQGGAVLSTAASSVVLSNSILWDNIPEEIMEDGGSVLASYSDVRGGWAGPGNLADDPLYVDLDAGDLRLGAGSPCIDAGNNFAVPGDVTIDIAGNERFVDDPDARDAGLGGPGDPLVDVGAFESQGPTSKCLGDVDENGDVGFLDLLSVIAYWGECEGCPEDQDDDGVVGFTDLLTVLSYWGPC